MTSPTEVKALPEVSHKYQVDEEVQKPLSKATMIAGPTLLIGLIILVLTMLVRTSTAEMNGTVVSNRVNHAIAQNRIEGKLMHGISKRSPDEKKTEKKDTKDAKKDDKKGATTPKPNSGERVESMVLTVFGMGALTLAIPHL